MDFFVGILNRLRKYESIWVIFDLLTKLAHFIPKKVDYNIAKLANLVK